MKTILQCFSIIVIGACPLFAQSKIGELRLKIIDPAGLGVQRSVELVSEANQFRQKVVTDEEGNVIARRIPFGLYRIEISEPGFDAVSDLIEIRTSAPTFYEIQLKLPGVPESVTVKAGSTLMNPDQAGSVNQIGSGAIQDRLGSLPGRSLQDLVNSQPGWLYEGNGVLHPRGSEYQTQFVVDGFPLTDNRSPGFGPEIEADDVESLTVYTAGIPAEYGRKMGGVIEVNTLRNVQPGTHGDLVLSGGSYDTVDGFAHLQNNWKKSTLGVSVAGSMTAHYLNPVVPENYTNRGTTGDSTIGFEHDFTAKDHIMLSVRHELARYEIPNERVQQFPELRTPQPLPGTPPQLQTADNFETMGLASYHHIFSSDFLANIRAMVRDNSNDLNSNPSSWPLIVFQHNNFREGYFNSSLTFHHSHQEWKAGVELDNLFLHEDFNDVITADPTNPNYPFDPGTPAAFNFAESRPNLEQAAYIQDLIHIRNWTVNAGLRWDHYQLLVNQSALSPRVAISHLFSKPELILHASYDRVFQTPSFANILLSSSQQVASLNPSVLRLPVEPSHGNYIELGASKGFHSQLRLDSNYFCRNVNNYADDDQILSTAISFPIAFQKAIIYGAESKIEVPHWNRFSGFLSYSYIVGNAWFPVTGGLFLGDAAVNATTHLSGHFPDSQDQRNTARTRIRYQAPRRIWLAGGAEYGSGLPFDFNGSYQQALAEYGQAVVDRINLNRGRIKPNFSVDASAGAELYKTEKLTLRWQADGENLNNRLNLIDFGGLFSGNAIAPGRRGSFRLNIVY
jgi:hypothetical protein